MGTARASSFETREDALLRMRRKSELLD